MDDIHNKRKRNRKRQLYVRISLFALFILFLGGVAIKYLNTGEEELTPPRLWTREEGIRHIQELSEENPDLDQILLQIEEYPDNLITALCNNMEMLEYARNYPNTEKKVYGTVCEEEKKNGIPLLMQWDPRWGYAPYGDDVIALSACGPTSLSMVLVGLTGNEDAAPDHVAAYAMEQGFYIPGVGTTWDLMTLGAEHFGVRGYGIETDKELFFSLIKEGIPIICSMNPGDFTAKGHFVVLTGIKNGKLCINDCMSQARSRKLWKWETFAPQVNQAWAFER